MGPILIGYRRPFSPRTAPPRRYQRSKPRCDRKETCRATLRYAQFRILNPIAAITFIHMLVNPVGLVFLLFFLFWGRWGRGVGLVGGGRRLDQGDVLVEPEPS